MKTRNCTIDAMKFVMALVIAFYHFYMQTHKHLIGGIYAVEFFFLAASLFFFAKLERETSKPALNPQNGSPYIYIYIRKRFVRFFPWTFSAFLFYILVNGGFPLKINAADYFAPRLGEIFLIGMNGFVSKKSLLNDPTWSLSSMLIVEFIFCYLWTRHKKVLTEFIVPISIVVGLGLWINLKSNALSSWIGFTCFGNLRAWVVYCAGYLSYLLAKRIKQISFNLRGRIAVTIVEIAGYLAAIAIMMWRCNVYYQWTCTAIMAVSLAISYSRVSLLEQILSGKWISSVCGYLGKLSFSVYLLHWGIHKMLAAHFSEPDVRYTYKWYYLICFLACSVLQLLIVPWFVKITNKFWTWTKRTLTKRA